jgi:T-complex protein 1 subunit theta
MTTAEDLLKFSAGEEAEVESQVKALADAGVSVVVAAGKFGDLYLHFLNKYGIMGVRLTSKVRDSGGGVIAGVLIPPSF